MVEPQGLASIMTSVERIDCGLIEARNTVEQEFNNYVHDNSGLLADLDTACREEFNIRSVKVELLHVLNDAKRKLKPLFEDDQRLGYFTCINFKGPYPWQKDLSETSKES